MKSFSVHLKRLIKDSGITQAEIAKRASVSPSCLSRFVSGERRPNMENAVALARALTVSVEDLLTNTTEQDVLGDWIHRTEFVMLERKSVQASLELDVMVAKLRASNAEAESLRSSLKEAEERVAILRIDKANLLASLQKEEARASELQKRILARDEE